MVGGSLISALTEHVRGLRVAVRRSQAQRAIRKAGESYGDHVRSALCALINNLPGAIEDVGNHLRRDPDDGLDSNVGGQEGQTTRDRLGSHSSVVEEEDPRKDLDVPLKSLVASSNARIPQERGQTLDCLPNLGCLDVADLAPQVPLNLLDGVAPAWRQSEEESDLAAPMCHA